MNKTLCTLRSLWEANLNLKLKWLVLAVILVALLGFFSLLSLRQASHMESDSFQTAANRPQLQSGGYLATSALLAPRSEIAEKKRDRTASGEDSLAIHGPIIARSAELAICAKNFEEARAAVEAIVARHGGYAAQLGVSGINSSRTLNASLRVPEKELDAVFTELRALGQVEKEMQASEELTQPYLDLTARISNAKTAEARMQDILIHRTGKISEVLEVEEQISNLRGQIERMQAELRTMQHHIAFATITLTVREQFSAKFAAAPPVLLQIRNALVRGFQEAFDSLVVLVLFAAAHGPWLLLWAVILFFPVRWLWKHQRNLGRQDSAPAHEGQGSIS